MFDITRIALSTIAYMSRPLVMIAINVSPMMTVITNPEDIAWANARRLNVKNYIEYNQSG